MCFCAAAFSERNINLCQDPGQRGEKKRTQHLGPIHREPEKTVSRQAADRAARRPNNSFLTRNYNPVIATDLLVRDFNIPMSCEPSFDVTRWMPYLVKCYNKYSAFEDLQPIPASENLVDNVLALYERLNNNYEISLRVNKHRQPSLWVIKNTFLDTTAYMVDFGRFAEKGYSKRFFKIFVRCTLTLLNIMGFYEISSSYVFDYLRDVFTDDAEALKNDENVDQKEKDVAGERADRFISYKPFDTASLKKRPFDPAELFNYHPTKKEKKTYDLLVDNLWILSEGVQINKQVELNPYDDYIDANGLFVYGQGLDGIDDAFIDYFNECYDCGQEISCFRVLQVRPDTTAKEYKKEISEPLERICLEYKFIDKLTSIMWNE